MPSFFESMKRLVSGQPVFQDTDNPMTTSQKAEANHDVHQQVSAAPTNDSQHHGPATPRDASGRKIMPVVRVKSVECHINGSHMECWGVIKNDSPQPIELEKILVLGHGEELGHLLRAGEERQCKLFDGAMPNNNSYKQAELQYKDHDGDWFAAVHNVEYDYHDGEKLYSISDLELQLPIRDIYG